MSLRQWALTPVPLPRWVPRRRPRRDYRALVRDSGVPEALGALVLATVKRARLWRSERADVADELLSHFRDALSGGADPAALAAGFGDPAVLAKLIRRAMRRKRPLAWRAWRRSLQGVAALVCLLVVVYVYAFIRFFGGAPNISRDYLAELNAPARALAPADRAWPLYREALLALRDLPNAAWEAHPDLAGWPEAVAALESRGPALAMVRAASARPGLGYVAGFTIDGEDRALWPDHEDNAGADRGLIGVLLPQLAEFQKLSRLLSADMHRAAAAGDAALVVADFEASLRMAGHTRAVSTMISDLVSLAMVNRALVTLGEILAARPQVLADAQLQHLAHEVAALDRQRIRVRLDGETMWFMDFLQRVYSDDGDGDGHITAAGLRWLDSGIVVDFHPDAAAYLMAPAVSIVMAGRREMTAKYEHVVGAAEAEAAKPLWEQDPTSYDREVEAMGGSVLGKARYLPIFLLAPAMTSACRKAEFVAQERDAVLVALALVVFQRRHGAWPESLDALVPDLLPSVPPDRFDGKPLRYRLVDGTPILYSIGWDRDDDGGRPAETGTQIPKHSDGDWVLWKKVESRE